MFPVMILGIDFDNTLVCYDELFHRVALERGLIPAELPRNKSEVRNHLRGLGREDDWTEMQGVVYGVRLSEAAAYPGALEFIRRAREHRIPVRIISHKTRHPYRGEAFDLHAAARGWLELHGVISASGLRADEIFFELTKADKLARIGRCECTHFIDDLPEFLAEPAFPSAARKLLFDPAGLYQPAAGCLRFGSWREISEALLA